MRKVVTQEINSTDGLRKLYSNVTVLFPCVLYHDLIPV